MDRRALAAGLPDRTGHPATGATRGRRRRTRPFLAGQPRPARTAHRRARPRPASIEGNALAACCRLGLAADPRIRSLAEALISWQWPDGGWNCDLAATGRSSFHESLAAAWGLHEYWQATGDTAAKDAASRAAELFLAHRLFRTLATGQVINRAWLAPHYPPYWHYDILQALLVLSRMGKAGDPRASDAHDELQRRRLPDGRWQPGGCWWKPAASTVAPEVADWGGQAPTR